MVQKFNIDNIIYELEDDFFKTCKIDDILYEGNINIPEFIKTPNNIDCDNDILMVEGITDNFKNNIKNKKIKSYNVYNPFWHHISPGIISHNGVLYRIFKYKDKDTYKLIILMAPNDY